MSVIGVWTIRIPYNLCDIVNCRDVITISFEKKRKKCNLFSTQNAFLGHATDYYYYYIRAVLPVAYSYSGRLGATGNRGLRDLGDERGAGKLRGQNVNVTLPSRPKDYTACDEKSSSYKINLKKR